MKCVLEFDKKKMGFGQSVYQNLVKNKMGFGQSVYQNLVKKDGFWTKCVLEFGKKMGFGRSVYQNLVKKGGCWTVQKKLVKKRLVLNEVRIKIW